MKGFRTFRKGAPHNTGEIVNPFGMPGKIVVRRFHHPKAGVAAHQRETEERDRKLAGLRAAAVARLLKIGVSDAAKLPDSTIRKLDADFLGAWQAKDANVERQDEDFACSLIASWSGEMFDVLPQDGRFDESMVRAAFFPVDRRPLDDEIVPHFFEVDADGNEKQPLYRGDELFEAAKKITAKAKAAMGEKIDDDDVDALALVAAREAINETADSDLAAINVRRHPQGGINLRRALALAIIAKAVALETERRETFSL